MTVSTPPVAPNLVLIVPCYDEAAGLVGTQQKLRALLLDLIAKKSVHRQSIILYVDDGSRDQTWAKILDFSRAREAVGLKLTRNFGHQAALLAGMDYALAQCQADCVITLDADLQDDINVLPTFIDKYQEGAEIVYGVRDARPSDTIFKRASAAWFYRLMAFLGIELVDNHADFRLLGRRALMALRQFPEAHIFLRGIIPLLGFSSATVTYTRKKRLSGQSKYPLMKMLAFAADGLFSFSIAPIKLIGTLGLLVMVVSLVMIVYSLIQRLLGNVEPGWSSLIVSIWFLGGVQLLSLRVIGEYLGRVFQQTKNRPRYLVETATT
jgi:glycosyltransferase involved in cell wall biosynthesis